MDEEKAVAILLANLKGGKGKPSKTTDFALACRTLKRHKEWGAAKMSKFFKVSTTQLREIDKINDLEPKYKRLANAGKIGLTTAYQISRVDPGRRGGAFEIIKNMDRDETRDFVYFLVKNPDLSVRECKKMFDESRLTKITVLALPITEEFRAALTKAAGKRKQTIHEYALRSIEKSLNRPGGS